MTECAVCNSEHREEIEQRMFQAPGATGELEKISEEYNVPVEDLQRHALFHAPQNGDGPDSIVRQIKMRETDMLAEAAADYMSTLQVVGKRIRQRARYSDLDDASFERALTKPVVELYTGCGSEIRGNVKAIADINQQLNGPKDDGSAGLLALAEALRSSRTGRDDE